MSNTKQTYLYARCFMTNQTPDLTAIRFFKKHVPSTEIACYPNSTLILVRVIKDEIIHLTKTTENPHLYTFHYKHGTVPAGTFIVAEEEWTRKSDIEADYTPLTKERIEHQIKQMMKPRKKATRAQWANIAIGTQTRVYKKKVGNHA